MNALLIVLFLRTFGSLLILAYPLAGGLFSMLADMYDFNIFSHLGWGCINFEMYQKMDKLLDSFYLTVEYIVSRRFEDPLLKRLLSWLFGWRMIFVAFFLLFGYRQALFFGLNVFEIFFILYLLVKKIKPDFRLKNNGKLIALILIISLFKLSVEYNLHVGSLKELLGI